MKKQINADLDEVVEAVINGLFVPLSKEKQFARNFMEFLKNKIRAELEKYVVRENELTKEKMMELILRKFHGHTKEQWEQELVKQYPFSEIPYLVQMVWDDALNINTRHTPGDDGE